LYLLGFTGCFLKCLLEVFALIESITIEEFAIFVAAEVADS